MRLGIRKNLFAIALLLTLGFSSQQSLAQSRSGLKAPLVAEIAFQTAIIERAESATQILDQALTLVETTQSDCYKSTPLMQVANGYRLIGQTQKGQQLLNRAFQIARTQTLANCRLSATSPEESLLNRAVAYAQAGNYELALSIIRGVDNEFRPSAMVRIAEAYQKDQQPAAAKQLLEEAIQLTQRIPDLRSRRRMLIGLGFALQRTGQAKSVLPILEQALDRARSQSPSEEEQTETLTQTLQLSEILIAAGEKSQAIARLDQVLPTLRVYRSRQFPSEHVNLLTQAAVQYAASGQLNQAKTVLAIARTQTVPSAERDFARVRVAQSYAAIGQTQTARELATRLKSKTDRESVLSAIALHFAKTGKGDQAVALARSLVTAKNLTLAEIVRYYLSQQQYDQALKVARQERVQGILPEVALAYAEAGNPDRAKQIVQSTPSLSNRADHLDWLMPALAQSFAKKGQFEQAVQVAEGTRQPEYRSRALIAIAAEYADRDRVANRAKATQLLNQALKIALSIK